jgi:butyryl-CoA dehydrogenase
MADPLDSLLSDAVLANLAGLADDADRRDDWPQASWDQVRQAGVTRWSIPADHGGLGMSSPQLLFGYEKLASACLTTAFILSQREAAVRRLCTSPVPLLQQRFLPGLARGEIFATVGLSQLTTSRQHRSPALVATPESPDHYRLDGLIPWVTGADHADIILVGAVLPDRRQVLLVLPAGQDGMTVDPPLSLLALAGSRTAQIRCDHVLLPADLVLAGPGEKLLAVGRGGVGGLETSCLALGLAGAAIVFLQQEAESRSELTETARRFAATCSQLRELMGQLARGPQEESKVVHLRVQATRLVLQATQASLTIAKGTGFVAPHPVQRWVRQALFFLVWSCPRSVAEGLLLELLPG